MRVPPPDIARAQRAKGQKRHRKNKAQPVRAQTFTLSEHLIRAQNLV
jgi:hypothetical protein